MDTPIAASSCKRSNRPEPLTVGKVIKVIWGSVWESLVEALLVLILGSIAVGIASGIWAKMAPSRPPVLADNLSPEAEPSAAWIHTKAFFTDHRFVLIFALLLTLNSATRLINDSGNQQQRRAAAWLQFARRRLSSRWFGLIVVNAFVASITAMLLQLAQEFSYTKMLWRFLIDLFRPLIDAVGNLLLGTGRSSALTNLVSWVDQNQLKFTFWFLYLAAICDDLGLPNLKTLTRWLWRRFIKRGSARPAERSPISTQPH